jgi:mannose-1-phosphate guanylyltransferase
MAIQFAASGKPLVSVEPVGPAPGQFWAIVLAGGEGMRLRPLTDRICADHRPKQYVPLFDGRSLLDQTLDRVGLVVPRARTAVVTVRSHSRYFFGPLTAAGSPHVLVQPDDRGTAAGVLFPAQWVAWQDPEATVAVFPSDHFILEEAAFMDHVARVAAWVGEHPDRLVLLGAQATGPEVEYGWIEPGRPLDAEGPVGIWEIRRFWEKPSADMARSCLEAGCLWNTFILVGKARTLVRAGQEALPEVADRLARIGRFRGTEHEGWAVQQAYALMPRANFSRSILEPAPPCLAVSQLPGVTWSDLGSPRRVLQVIRSLGMTPSWAQESTEEGAYEAQAAAHSRG